MAGQPGRNSSRYIHRTDERKFVDTTYNDSERYSRTRYDHSPYSRSPSPSRRRGRSSSDDRYRYVNRSSRRTKRCFDDTGVVLLFIPQNVTHDSIYNLFENYQTVCRNIELRKNKDGVTMHAFVDLGSLSNCRQFLSRTISGVVSLEKCRIKVVTEDNYHDQIYMGHHLYETPELPSALNSDSLARSLIENPPCNVLIFKSLDYSATEDQVRESVTNLTSDPLYDVRVIKDKSTGLSRGFCFVEMGNVADATKLLNIILHKVPYYMIGNRRILAGFARMNTYNSNGISSLLPTTVDTFTSEKSIHANRVANDAIAAAQISSIPLSNAFNSDSTMTYDTQSGYFFDNNSGYYYDPNSGYYYDPERALFLYYDQNSNQWMTVPNSTESTAISSVVTSEEISNSKIIPTKSKDVEKNTKSLEMSDPKQIAKEMEKWAKKMNVNKKVKQLTDNVSKVHETRTAFKAVNLDNDHHHVDESQPFLVWDRLLCLLCVRKFKSKSILEKHINLSQLHKNNLTIFNAKTVLSLNSKSSPLRNNNYG